MRGPLACVVAISTGSDNRVVVDSDTKPTALKGPSATAYYGRWVLVNELFHKRNRIRRY